MFVWCFQRKWFYPQKWDGLSTIKLLNCMNPGWTWTCWYYLCSIVSGGPHPSKKGRTWKDQTCTIGITTRCRSVVFVGFQNPPIITYLFKQIHNRSAINPTVRLVIGPGAGGEFPQDPQVRRRVAARSIQPVDCHRSGWGPKRWLRGDGPVEAWWSKKNMDRLEISVWWGCWISCDISGFIMIYLDSRYCKYRGYARVYNIYIIHIYYIYMHACMLYFHVCPCISLKGHDRYIARDVICECCPKSSLWLRETRFNWMYCSLSLEPMSDDVRCPRQETMELCFHASPWHRNSLFA